MNDFSVLIGGKAGFGIDKASLIIARILNQLGFYLYIYRDYPSLIRGGHTFSIIRACEKKIGTHRDKIDFLLVLNQDTFNFHKSKLKDDSIIIYDSDSVKLEGMPNVKSQGIPLAKIIKEENAPEITRNTCVVAAFCKVAGISWDILDSILKKEITRAQDTNLKVAHRGYDEVKESLKVTAVAGPRFPVLSGNQAIGLGLIKAGLDTYIAYPMTPSSPLLHFLADVAPDFGLKVIHPESEISVMLMALGFSYMGKRVAVGTSGGGFCLMTEGLSFSGMAELPVVIMVGQRPGPSTGLPTYSCQTELHFILNAGQGEFVRFIVAPGDPEEAYFWSAKALNISWKYQIPSFILSDKNLGEGGFSFDPFDAIKENMALRVNPERSRRVDIDSTEVINEGEPLLWDGKFPYKRYLNTENGISPLAFAPAKDAVIKVNSYEHDEYGITTEEPKDTVQMQDKRLRKEKYLAQDLEEYETVKVYGENKSSTAMLCWGSNKGVAIEAAQNLKLKVIQPIVLSPFPVKQFQEACRGVEKLICVENNATAQLARLIKNYGFNTDQNILKYDGRPFSLDELETALKKIHE